MSNYQLANLILGQTVHFSISVLLFFAAVSACIHFIDGAFTQKPAKPPKPAKPVPTPKNPSEPVPARFELVLTLPEPTPIEFNPPIQDFPTTDFSLDLLSIRELKAMASQRKVKNYGRFTKAELVKALTFKH